MKKAVCISIFNHYDNRVLFAEKFLAGKGFDVTYIASDFDHYIKDKYKIERENVVQVRGKPYYKNISVQRLQSHHDSANECLKVLEEIKPDLIYTLVPPNSQSRVVAKYKKKHKDTIVLMDLFDLWPETFPSLKKNLLLRVAFYCWRNVRDAGLDMADYIITECGLYRMVLENQLSDKKSKILHLCKTDYGRRRVLHIDTSPLNICYLGSINNIIDIETIIALLREMAKHRPLVLHVIGGGENTKALLDFDEENDNIKVEYYGILYDEAKKHEIMDKCAFALNILKKTVCIGLTMKSVDYFEAGVPIINNVSSDTSWIIDKYGAGFNIDDDLQKCAAKIMAMDEKKLITMRYSTRRAYEEMFSEKVYFERFEEIFEELELD